MDIRSYNVGESDYSKHKFQVWDLWIDYKLNAFDGDLLKRTLRNKKTDGRKLDLEKIKHICLERIRQIDENGADWIDYPVIHPNYSIMDITEEYKLGYEESMIIALILIPTIDRKKDYEKIIEYVDKLLLKL